MALRKENTADLEKQFFEELDNGSIIAVRPIILNHMVDLNLRSAKQRAAIHISALRNQAGTVQLLCDEKADLNVQDEEGNTPLHLAAGVNARTTIHVLIRQGATSLMRNAIGRTAYMIALENNAKDAIAEFQANMVPWSIIEETIGRERNHVVEDKAACVRHKVQKLLELGFDDMFADPIKFKKGCHDKLQIPNQLVVLDPDSTDAGRCCCLETRGQLICKELLLPLISLAGQYRLESADFVKYKRFARYLLMSGCAVFAGVEVVFAVQRGIEDLEHELVTLGSDLSHEVKRFTERPSQLCGMGEGWKSWHQVNAHGDLAWLPSNGVDKNTLGALIALVEADVFHTVEDLCVYAAPTAEKMHNVNVAMGQDAILQQLWDTVYAKWLLGLAAQAHHGVLALATERWGTRHRSAPLKSFELVLEKKQLHRDACKEEFGVPKGQFSSVSHVLEAGCVRDLLRFSITVANVEALKELLDEFRELRMSPDGMELISIQNNFWLAGNPRGGAIKDIRLGVMISVPPAGPMILAEVQLLLKKFIVIKKHRCFLESYVEGVYVDANSGMRAGCAERVRGQSASITSNGSRPSSAATSAAPDAASKEKKPPGTGQAKLRFAISLSKGFVILWWWAFERELEHVGLLTAPKGSVTRDSGLDDWVELGTDGSELETEEDCPTRIALDKPMILSDFEILLAEDDIELLKKDIDTIMVQMLRRDVRLFRDQYGELCQVSDHIILKVEAPSVVGRGAVLVRETPTSVLPTMHRKANEGVIEVATKLAKRDLPDFLVDALDFHPFQESDGFWVILSEPYEASVAGSFSKADSRPSSVISSAARPPSTDRPPSSSARPPSSGGQTRKSFLIRQNSLTDRPPSSSAAGGQTRKSSVQGRTESQDSICGRTDSRGSSGQGGGMKDNLPFADRYFVMRATFRGDVDPFTLVRMGMVDV